jgi:hypothetical protein
MDGCCEHGNELLGSINCWIFFVPEGLSSSQKGPYHVKVLIYAEAVRNIVKQCVRFYLGCFFQNVEAPAIN